MRFQLLGPLEVTRDEERIQLGGPKQRLVLAHLLLRANQVVSTDLLIDEIWGEEPPDAARASLQSYVSHLRKALGEGRLEGRSPGYILHADPGEVDAAGFENLVAQARRRLDSDPASSARMVSDALALWQGEPLADLANELSLQAEIQRLSELRLGAIEDRIEAELALGRHAEVIAELEGLASRHPLRERLHRQLMLAHYRSGRQADALAAYHRLRGSLDAELGLDPSPAIELLQGQILNHDPGLDLRGEPLRGYRIVEQIGTGPLGAVHRAFEPQTERDVAIKVLYAAVANDSRFVRRFEKEARRIARLEHPHVVPLHDWWREPDAAYLVMRLLRGGSLADRLGRAHVSSVSALHWAEQLGGALTAAHRQGVIHGDLRPGNVLFDAEDNAYVSDFAVAYDPALDASDRLIDMDLRYLAPERRAGGPPSVPADIYAFGVVLAELFHAASQGVDGAALRAALERATSAAPADRPPSPTDLAAAVRRALLAPGPSEPVAERPMSTHNPYKGLRAFEETDAPDFFGREDLVGLLVERLAEKGDASRLLALVGPSGSGKSSVVSAGLIPALRVGGVPGSEEWFIATLNPGERPFDELEQALLGVAIGESASVTELLASRLGLGPIVERILPLGTQLLIFIDQFEELFTLVQDDVARQRFLDLIAATIGDQTARVRVVITLRADFYDRPLRHERFGRHLAARTQAVPPLTPEELERVIRQPAERAGLHLEQGLVARIVSEMSERPGALPLLQYTLSELWERRDGRSLSLHAYDASGGIMAAVGRRAEQLVRELDADGREVARQLFLRLVELGEGTPDTARRVPTSELQAVATDRRRMEAVIESFARFRLLLFDRDPETREPTLELAHEALLRAWPRLQQWVDEARDDLRQQRRLAAAAAQWLEAGRDRSFVLTGGRLDQMQHWAASTRVLLAPAEQEYLAASLAEQQRLQAEEEQRQAQQVILERRAIGRLRALVVTLGLGALLAGGLSVFALSESQRAAREARVATAREVAGAAVANLDVDPERSILLALAAVDHTRSADGTVLREAVEALHRAVVASRAVLTVHDEGGYLAWADSHDLGSIFVTQGPEDSGIVNVRNALTGDVLRSWRAHDIDVNDVALSADGSLLATTGDDGRVRIWAPNTQTEVASLAGPAGGEVWGPSFSPDGSLLAANWSYEDEDTGVTRVLDVDTGETVLEIADLGTPWRTAFSPDGARLAVGFAGGPVALVFDVGTGEELLGLEGHEGPLRDVAYSPDGRWIGTAAGDGTAKVWNAQTGVLRFTLFGHGEGLTDLDWSSDSERLITGSLDGTAKVWEISEAGPRELGSLGSQDLGGGVGGVVFSPDGSRVITAQNGDHAVKVWDLSIAGDAEWLNLPAPAGALGGIAMSSASAELVASTADGSIAVWDLETARIRLEESQHREMVLAIEVSPDGSLIASAGIEGVRVWSAATGELHYSIPLAEDEEHGWVQTVAWSPDGTLLATASVAGSVTIRDRGGNEQAVLPEGPGVGVYAARFSPDGRLLATSVKHAEGERYDAALHHVSIWDWQTQSRVSTIPTSSLGLAFNPAGTLLVTSNVDGGYAEIWDLTSGESQGRLAGHTGTVGDAAWDPDTSRNWIATASNDATVRLWNATTGVNELVLRGHQAPVWQVRFSPDGSRLASISSDGTVRVWALDLDDLITIARNKLTRELVDEECRQYLRIDACPTTH